MVKPAKARELLLRAKAGYAARGDAAGRLRTLAHLAYLSFVDFAPDYPITRWLDELGEVASRFDELPSAEEKAQVAMTVVHALLVGDPVHPELPRWRQRALDALHAPIGLHLRARVASVLGINLLWSGLFEQLGAMHALLARNIEKQGLTDYGQLVWGLVELDAAGPRARRGPGVLRRLLATAEQWHRGAGHLPPAACQDAQLATGDWPQPRRCWRASAATLPSPVTRSGMRRSERLAGDLARDTATAPRNAQGTAAAMAPDVRAFGWIALALAHACAAASTMSPPR